MSPRIEAAKGGFPLLLVFLREQLSPRPGRAAAVTRVAVCSSFIVLVWMVFQIPLPAYAAYVVFLVSRAEAAGTLIAAVGSALAATLAIAVTLVLYTFDASEPALRLPLMAGVMFVGMYLSRVIAIGPIAFLIGFLLVITQTLVDDVPNLEILTRFILWLWVIAVVPCVLTALVNLAFGQNPAKLARDSAVHLLGVVANSLRGQSGLERIDLSAAVTMLAEARHNAGVLDRDLRAYAATDTAQIEWLDELVRLASVLPATVPLVLRSALADRCDVFLQAVASRQSPILPPLARSSAELAELDAQERPVVIAIENVLNRLAEGLAQRQQPQRMPAEAHTRSFFVADAFSNPDYVRFALKSTLAAMAVYILYTAMDWPGIRTSLVTCFFVALSTVGETIHKLTLRLGGALVGGLIGGLCIVYLLPHMTDIGELVVLIAVISALCAWVATGSDLLAYAGMQAAFAFFIGVLQGYGPATDLTVLRDRVAGIVLGNVVMSLVFSLVWPVRAAANARSALAAALRALARLLVDPRGPRPGDGGSRLVVVEMMGRARRLVAVSTFETAFFPRDALRPTAEQKSLQALERIAAATFVVVNQTVEGAAANSHYARNDELAAWISEYAAQLVGDEPGPLAPGWSGIENQTESSPTRDSLVRRSAGEAQSLMGSILEEARLHAT